MSQPHTALDKPVVLASNSPRRRELLRQIGVVFTSDAANVDERVLPDESPERYAVRVALDKARVAGARSKNGIVIAADTIVVLNDTILGKPVDDADAIRILTMLAGRMHRVMTGVAVMDISTEKILARIAVTKVWFHRLTHDEIVAYVATREPMDKAGAYGIQEKGALLVEKIDGCYFNVVGLPLSLLGEMLKEFGIDLLL